MKVRFVLQSLALFLTATLCISSAGADTLVKMRFFPGGGEVRFGAVTAPTSITLTTPTPGGDPQLQEHRQRTQTFAIPDPTANGGFTIPGSFPNPIPVPRTFINNTLFGGTSVRSFLDFKNAGFNFSTTAVSSIPLPATIVGVMLVSIMGATGMPVPPATATTILPTNNRKFGPNMGWAGQGADLTFTASQFAPNAASHPTLTTTTIPFAARFTGTAMVQPGPNQFGGTMKRVGNLDAFLIIQNTLNGTQSLSQFSTGIFPVKFNGGTISSMEGGGNAGPAWITRATIVATLNRRITPFSTGVPTDTTMNPLFFTAGDWGTGAVQVAALDDNGFLQTRNVAGFDDRNATGPDGTTRVLQMVRPLLEQQNLNVPGVDGQAETAHLRITFMPEPGSMMMIAAGFLGLVVVKLRLRSRR